MSLVFAARVTLVPMFCAVTVAWGTTAPELSVTSPEMSPEIFCPNSQPHAINMKSNTKVEKARGRRRSIIVSPKH